MQLWTIVDLTSGDVLAAAFPTPSIDSHPKDNGWAWDAETQEATRINKAPDLASQDWTGAAWADDLVKIRLRRWAEIKAARDRAQDGGCDTSLGRVDTDPDSRGKISGAVQLAMLAQVSGDPFALPWTMQDNATVVHDATAMIGMGVAVGRHVAACHAEALARRVSIEAAADAAAIAAVDIEGGWPGAIS